MSQLKLNGKTETLCIFGHPVGHSKSPLMHNALFDALGINAAYLPYAPEPENFAKAVEGFKALKFRGANVTIPYKTEFFETDGSARLIDELSDISKFTGSVNTLYWKDGIVGGTLRGTTTDPYGCIRNLEENGVDVSNKRVALLGNGGAAKAIAFTLVEQGNALTIVCRTAEKGQALADSLNAVFVEVGVKVCRFHCSLHTFYKHDLGIVGRKFKSLKSLCPCNLNLLGNLCAVEGCGVEVASPHVDDL